MNKNTACHDVITSTVDPKSTIIFGPPRLSHVQKSPLDPWGRKNQDNYYKKKLKKWKLWKAFFTFLAKACPVFRATSSNSDWSLLDLMMRWWKYEIFFCGNLFLFQKGILHRPAGQHDLCQIFYKSRLIQNTITIFHTNTEFWNFYSMIIWMISPLHFCIPTF